MFWIECTHTFLITALFMHCLVTRLRHFSCVPMSCYRDNCETWNYELDKSTVGGKLNVVTNTHSKLVQLSTLASLLSSLFENKIACSTFPFMYINIRFTAIMWDTPRFCINWLNRPILNAKSGLVLHKYLKHPINIRNWVKSTFSFLCSFIKLKLVTTWVRVGLQLPISTWQG